VRLLGAASPLSMRKESVEEMPPEKVSAPCVRLLALLDLHCRCHSFFILCLS